MPASAVDEASRGSPKPLTRGLSRLSERRTSASQIPQRHSVAEVSDDSDPTSPAVAKERTRARRRSVAAPSESDRRPRRLSRGSSFNAVLSPTSGDSEVSPIVALSGAVVTEPRHADDAQLAASPAQAHRKTRRALHTNAPDPAATVVAAATAAGGSVEDAGVSGVAANTRRHVVASDDKRRRSFMGRQSSEPVIISPLVLPGAVSSGADSNSPSRSQSDMGDEDTSSLEATSSRVVHFYATFREASRTLQLPRDTTIDAV